jgi:uncharacterized protein YcnI
MKNIFATQSIASHARFYWSAAVFGSVLSAFSMPVAAHVVLEYQVANAGSYYKATFKVGHGCGPSPVRQIVVTMPAGVQGAKPMPKAGWVLDIAQDAASNVSRITWTAKTPADYLHSDWYDEFVLQAKLPSKDGSLYWPVSQICEEGRVDWTQIPQAGQKLSDLKNPAAVLELMPTSGSGEHKH